MQAFQQQGLVIQAALADTLGAAWGLALCKDFPQIVPPGESATSLADLLFAALHLIDEVKLLSELGIERIGQLLPLLAMRSCRGSARNFYCDWIGLRLGVRDYRVAPATAKHCCGNPIGVFDR